MVSYPLSVYYANVWQADWTKISVAVDCLAGGGWAKKQIAEDYSDSVSISDVITKYLTLDMK